jgi:arylsulfatase A-like enzyme
MPDRPHVVLFNPDQWRGDMLGHAGTPGVRTPNLDRLVATEAVSFAQAFCQNPVCTPSRCSFMTGWYPHVRGHRTMFHMLRDDEPMLLRRLKDAGYFVWWGGKNDVVPAQHGFEDYCDVKYEPAPSPAPKWGVDRVPDWRGAPESNTYYSFYLGRIPTADDEPHYPDPDWAHVHGALDHIERYAKSDDDRPLCLYLPLAYPHPPYAVEDPWYSAIDRAALPKRIRAPDDGFLDESAPKPRILSGIASTQNLFGWSEAQWRELRATYVAMCARVDYQLGLVIHALREHGLYDETALLFFSDHGDFTGDYGLVEKTQNTFEDCLTRVPLVIKPPAGVPVAPGTRDALVELVDIPATVEALTGLTPRYTHFGRSLLPLLHDPDAPHRDAVFCEGGRLHGETHCMELESTGGEPKPSSLYWPRLKQQRTDGPAHTKAIMCRTARYKYVRRLYEADELYDLERDPGERTNRIYDPALSAVRDRLRDRLLTFLVTTSDVVPHDADNRW